MTHEPTTEHEGMPLMPQTLEEWRAEALEQFQRAENLSVSEMGFRNALEIMTRSRDAWQHDCALAVRNKGDAQAALAAKDAQIEQDQAKIAALVEALDKTNRGLDNAWSDPMGLDPSDAGGVDALVGANIALLSDLQAASDAFIARVKAEERERLRKEVEAVEFSLDALSARGRVLALLSEEARNGRQD